MTGQLQATVVTHGGAGGSRDQDDGCRFAAATGLDRLAGGGSALDGEHWQQLNNSGGFAFHIAGQFPGLNLAFWAIRG